MRKLSVLEAVVILEKIDHGRRDASTLDPRFAPVWRHPFLRETLLDLLEADMRGDIQDVDLNNFVVVCNWLSPEFAEVLDQIDLDFGDTADISGDRAELAVSYAGPPKFAG